MTQQPGESFLDKMIALVEGATRQKTPNEIALTILLAGFTLVFVIVCVTLIPMADYTNIDHPGNLYLHCSHHFFVCLLDTDYYRRTAFCHRHCWDGPCFAR